MSEERAARLEQLVVGRELDALLVTDLVNVRYITGFTGTNAACVVGPGLRIFITDFRYLEQAEQQVAGFERVQGRQELLAEVGERLAGRIGFDDAHVTVRRHGRLGELVDEGVELVAEAGLVEQLRAVKDRDELDAISRAAALTDEVYEHLCRRGLVGRSERDVAIDLEREMREQGAEGPSFPSIVASGAHGALPHASPRDERIASGALVIVDMGCVLDGYCSDCTRTFATGKLSDEARAVYELVLEAQETALAAVVAGARCREVDALAREAIVAAGHEQHFGHGLGHGVGLEIHEAPRLSPSAGEEDLLEQGSVVTVEPGVYLPGKLGVRIEDLVVVGAEGPEVLSRFPKGLITLGA